VKQKKDSAKDIGANLKQCNPVLAVLLEQDCELEQLCPLASSDVTTNNCVCAFQSTLKILFKTELPVITFHKNNQFLLVIRTQERPGLQC
jgi:hypothetical protein